jgi:hypothetical protein
MFSRTSPLSRIAFAAALSLAAASVPAAAQEEHRGFSLDLFGSHFTVSADGDSASEEGFGLRGSYRFTNVWAVEGALSRLKDDDDLWIGDLSAKAYLIDANRFELYALAGLGQFKIPEDDETTFHVGVGAEIALGEKAYLRPEVRGRWFADSVDVATFVDYSVGFGWRF